jgi:precorrin isomerase
MELELLEITILRSIIFTESFAAIVEECKVTTDSNIVADGLKSLLKKKLVRPMKPGIDKTFVPSLVYDSDRMHAFHYQATAKGISWLEEHKKV